MTPSRLESINLKRRGTAHVLAPHPDDFDAIAVTCKYLQSLQWRIVLSVLTGGENGVADGYEGVSTREEKRNLRRQEQRDSCAAFGLDPQELSFLDLDHDEAGLLQMNKANSARINTELDGSSADLLLMPHISDSNKTHRICAALVLYTLCQKRRSLHIWFNRDEKTVKMRDELYIAFDDSQAQWKAGLLRLHASQQHRNLQTRGVGFDERVLEMNRRTAMSLGLVANDGDEAAERKYAESFEVCSDAAEEAQRLKLSINNGPGVE